MLRVMSGTRRWLLLLLALLLSLVFVLPLQSHELLQAVGRPAAQAVALPMGALAAIDRGVRDTWEGYIAVRQAYEDNRRLRAEIAALRAHNGELREQAAATERLAALLQFKQQLRPETVAAQVVGRDTTNWYHGVILNKGERDGIRVDMGVITPFGVVGRIAKTTPTTSVVLLLTDPNNAITGLIQRTRDEGIVEGTLRGRARIKYLPLLSAVQEGDLVVTSGLTGGFPRGLVIGTIRQIEKRDDHLLLAAEIEPEAHLAALEEVLVITRPRPLIPQEKSAGRGP